MSLSQTGHQGLYPIIRRMRRPLLPVDPPREVKPQVVNAEHEVKSLEPEKADEKKSDAGDSGK